MLRSTLLLIAVTSAVSALELGCFSDTSETLSNFVNNGSYVFQSIGYCQQVCDTTGHSYFALKGNNCWCGDAIPPISDMVDDSNCNIPCAGYVRQNCMFISVERKLDMLFLYGLY
jgi:cell wall integrity and stress response component